MLLTGKYPFLKGENTKFLFSQIKAGNYNCNDIVLQQYPKAKEFIKGCMKLNPNKRFSSLELMQSDFLMSNPDYYELTKFEESLPKFNALRHATV